MTMTKRDIADIVFACMAVYFLMELLASFVALGALAGMTDEAEKFTNKSIHIAFQSFHFLVLLLLVCVLLFKRSLILSMVFPDGRDKGISMPSDMQVLSSYVFWIRLLGIFTFLSSGIHFLARLGVDVAAKGEFMTRSYWMYSNGVEMVSALLGIIVVWKADWIANKLGNDRNKKKRK